MNFQFIGLLMGGRRNRLRLFTASRCGMPAVLKDDCCPQVILLDLNNAVPLAITKIATSCIAQQSHEDCSATLASSTLGLNVPHW